MDQSSKSSQAREFSVQMRRFHAFRASMHFQVMLSWTRQLVVTTRQPPRRSWPSACESPGRQCCHLGPHPPPLPASVVCCCPWPELRCSSRRCRSPPHSRRHCRPYRRREWCYRHSCCSEGTARSSPPHHLPIPHGYRFLRLPEQKPQMPPPPPPPPPQAPPPPQRQQQAPPTKS